MIKWICWQLRIAMGFYGENRRRTTSPTNFDKLQSTVNKRLATLALWGREVQKFQYIR